MKSCSSCLLDKDISYFRKWRSICKKCESSKQLERAKKDPETFRRRENEWRAKNPALVKKQKSRSYAKRSKEAPELFKAATARAVVRRREVHSVRYNTWQAARRAKKLRAMPSWANEFFISEAYDIAKNRTLITGIEWHVDHIVPLNSKVVCGLHTEQNLQVIPAAINCSKSNRHWPDMPVQGELS